MMARCSLCHTDNDVDAAALPTAKCKVCGEPLAKSGSAATSAGAIPLGDSSSKSAGKPESAPRPPVTGSVAGPKSTTTTAIPLAGSDSPRPVAAAGTSGSPQAAPRRTELGAPLPPTLTAAASPVIEPPAVIALGPEPVPLPAIPPPVIATPTPPAVIALGPTPLPTPIPSPMPAPLPSAMDAPVPPAVISLDLAPTPPTSTSRPAAVTPFAVPVPTPAAATTTPRPPTTAKSVTGATLDGIDAIPLSGTDDAAAARPASAASLPAAAPASRPAAPPPVIDLDLPAPAPAPLSPQPPASMPTPQLALAEDGDRPAPAVGAAFTHRPRATTAWPPAPPSPTRDAAAAAPSGGAARRAPAATGKVTKPSAPLPEFLADLPTPADARVAGPAAAAFRSTAGDHADLLDLPAPATPAAATQAACDSTDLLDLPAPATPAPAPGDSADLLDLPAPATPAPAPGDSADLLDLPAPATPARGDGATPRAAARAPELAARHGTLGGAAAKAAVPTDLPAPVSADRPPEDLPPELPSDLPVALADELEADLPAPMPSARPGPMPSAQPAPRTEAAGAPELATATPPELLADLPTPATTPAAAQAPEELPDLLAADAPGLTSAEPAGPPGPAASLFDATMPDALSPTATQAPHAPPSATLLDELPTEPDGSLPGATAASAVAAAPLAVAELTLDAATPTSAPLFDASDRSDLVEGGAVGAAGTAPVDAGISFELAGDGETDVAPALMDELMPPDMGAGAGPGSAVATPTAVAPADEKNKKEKKGLPRRTLALAGTLVVVVAAAAFTAKQLELFPFARTPTSAGTPNVATMKGKEPPPAKQKAKAPADKPPPRPPPPALASDNVHTLAFADLRASLQAAAPESLPPGLRLWALYRMAALGDAAAQAELTQATKGVKPAGADELSVAAAAGALLLEGKVMPARTLAERQMKTRFSKSAALAVVAAATYKKPAEAPKALKAYDLALAREPKLYDAALARACLALLRGKEDRAGEAEKLVTLVREAKDPALTLTAYELLLDVGELGACDAAASALSEADLTRVPEARVDALRRLLVRKHLRRGDRKAALASAEARLAASPTSEEAGIELARLQAVTDVAAAAKTLATARAANAADEARTMRLFAEEVRLRLAHDDTAGAQKLLSETTPPTARPALGFFSYAQGLVSERAGDIAAARKSYTAAAQGQPTFIEPPVALVRLSADKPGPALTRLTQLAAKSGAPAAEIPLAKQMAARGNHGGAAALLDAVLWQDPTLDPSFALLGDWVTELTLAGDDARAEVIATAMHEVAPKDERPLALLYGVAKQRGDSKKAVEWQRAILAIDPTSIKRKLGVANALIEAGAGLEAEAIVNEVLKEKPDAKTPELLIALGRALASRDVVKARSLMVEANAIKPTPEAYAAIGELERKQGRPDEAVEAFKKSLELAPDQAAARLALARVLEQKRALEPAADELRRVLATDPNNAPAADLLGDVLAALGQFKEAAQAYQKGLDAAGEQAALLTKLARVQNDGLGDTAEAAKTLQRAVRADPENAELHCMLGLALKDLNRPRLAVKELETCITLAPKGEMAEEARRTIDDLGKP